MYDFIKLLCILYYYPSIRVIIKVIGNDKSCGAGAKSLEEWFKVEFYVPMWQQGGDSELTELL